MDISHVVKSATQMATPTPEVTQLLRAWQDGDEAALQKLTPLVQAELHRLARRYMARERIDHTLQPTALINEAWMRLIDWRNADWQNRAHFFAVSAQLMRHILVDYARRRPRFKNAEDGKRVSLDEALDISPERTLDLVALDDALNSLAAMDPRKGKLVELRFFGGLTEEETAEVLKISAKTVQREWIKARAWLYYELSKQE
jgi:RNA polymerase sigma factor (TIGR02999 family)